MKCDPTMMKEEKLGTLRELLKQMHALMAGGKGDEPTDVSEAVQEAEKEVVAGNDDDEEDDDSIDMDDKANYMKMKSMAPRKKAMVVVQTAMKKSPMAAKMKRYG